MLQMSVRRDYGIDVVEGALSTLSPPDQLSRWLAGRWALLFSHPRDFATHGFEADRWLVCLRDTFNSLRLRAIAVGYGDASSWVTQIGGLFLPTYEVEDLVPPLQDQACAKTGQSEPEHFVTILDNSVRARRTFLYRADSQAPSVIELAQTAGRLCERAGATSVRRILRSV